MTRNDSTQLLWICLTLFILRVVGQLLAYWFNTPLLPPFDAWYSGAISYQYLVMWQLIIIVLMAIFAFRFTHSLVTPNHRIGYILKSIAILYFSIMLLRLIISLLGLIDHYWFNRPLPSFFHLVLASYLFISGHYHLSNSR